MLVLHACEHNVSAELRCVCVCVCLCVFVCVCIHVCMYWHACVQKLCDYTCMCAYTSACVCMCVSFSSLYGLTWHGVISLVVLLHPLAPLHCCRASQPPRPHQPALNFTCGIRTKSPALRTYPLFLRKETHISSTFPAFQD